MDIVHAKRQKPQRRCLLIFVGIAFGLIAGIAFGYFERAELQDQLDGSRNSVAALTFQNERLAAQRDAAVKALEQASSKPAPLDQHPSWLAIGKKAQALLAEFHSACEALKAERLALKSEREQQQGDRERWLRDIEKTEQIQAAIPAVQPPN